ncbi:ABC transporter substrate-binding protein [Vampirovibrio chlorellavorus]|uniref:ABC transporter substrate-binding protein n=1 Tax=Vampirovibrio chlorellavorus TaxID=758823 RepID=UPI0026EB8036|nr:sugar ABC transporter substrate-binding protein [Vampirovibrio chlorellavorus]
MGQSLQKFKDATKRLSKQTLGLAALGLIVAGLVGCQTRPTARSVQIQLSTWGSAQEVAVLKSLLRDFERSHPQIRVQLLHIPENYYQKLHILVAGDMAPDVIFTNSLSFPIYASQGIFRDLRPYLAPGAKNTGASDENSDRVSNGPSEALSEAQFYPQALKAFRWRLPNGQRILGALPRDISNVVIFYNRDLFRQAGLAEPRAGWTWEQFREIADRLTVDANNDGDPDQFGVSFYSTPPLFWLPFVWSAGGDLFSPDLRRFTLNQAKAVEGLRFYADLRHKWHVAPKKVESGGTSMSQLFLQQKVAMLVSGRWSVPVFREQAKFRWDVVPLPVGPSGQSRVGIDASGYAIAAKSQHPTESFALIRYLLSREAVRTVTESGLIVPARPDVATSAAFLSPHQAPAHGQAFLDVIPEGVPTHTPPRWNEVAEELGLALEPVWDGQQDPAMAMAAVKPKLDALLEVSP